MCTGAPALPQPECGLMKQIVYKFFFFPLLKKILFEMLNNDFMNVRNESIDVNFHSFIFYDGKKFKSGAH